MFEGPFNFPRDTKNKKETVKIDTSHENEDFELDKRVDLFVQKIKNNQDIQNELERGQNDYKILADFLDNFDISKEESIQELAEIFVRLDEITEKMEITDDLSKKGFPQKIASLIRKKFEKALLSKDPEEKDLKNYALFINNLFGKCFKKGEIFDVQPEEEKEVLKESLHNFFMENKIFFDKFRDKKAVEYFSENIDMESLIKVYTDYLFSDYKKKKDEEVEKFKQEDGGGLQEKNKKAGFLEKFINNPKYRSDIGIESKSKDDWRYSVHHYNLVNDNFLLLDPKLTGEIVLEKLAEKDLDEKRLEDFAKKYATVLGSDEAKLRIGEKIEELKKYPETNKDRIERLRKIKSYFTMEGLGEETIEALEKFYQEKIKFEEYVVNEKMKASEVKMLQQIINRKDKVLEIGCGTGRLLLEMQKAGYDISGFDFTPRHVEIIKEKSPEARVFQGDWHNIQAENESLDVAYSLGRNILHDYSISDQIRSFQEVARVLKKGGKFIFDIPNRKKGSYGELVEGYSEEMKKRGIKNYSYGTIYDSPDGKYFATRYAYSHQDIIELAELAGFKIEKVERKKLETGKDDENLYYILRKKD